MKIAKSRIIVFAGMALGACAAAADSVCMSASPGRSVAIVWKSRSTPLSAVSSRVLPCVPEAAVTIL